jgi:ParB family chromosome partitioning protein
MSEKAVAEKVSEQRLESRAGAKVAGEKSVGERSAEKIVEKRRALGRGLESLLPLAHRGEGVVGPRMVAGPVATPAASPAVNAESVSAQPGASAAAGDPAGATASRGHEATVAELRASAGEEVVTLALELIDDNPHQTRMDFLSGLAELTKSIEVQGVLQPIAVRPGKEGRYTLILGERRLRASRMAGKETIPAIVKRVSEQQAAEMTLIENLQRRDLNCVEQAEAFRNLSRDFKLTQDEIGGRVGVSRETVANYIRLLSLPEGVLSAMIGGRLTFSHARILLQLADKVQMWTYGKKAIDEGLSVAKLEELVMGVVMPRHDGEGKPGGGKGRWVDPNVRAAQRSLETALGMRVKIRDRNGRGKIVIEYGTLEDFDRVVRMLKGN